MKKRIIKSYTLTPAAVKSIESICLATGMDATAVVDGAVRALWATIVSNGLRPCPSAAKALAITGAAGGSFYVEGEKQ